MSLTYNKAIELIQSKGRFYIDLSLDRVKKILNILGNIENKINIIHIAGTNGKGSVSATLAKILESAGYKTGLYTSPHLIDYSERIKINSVDISQQKLADYIDIIISIADKNNIHLTEFEILTVCAFKYFYDNKIDIAVIETGLGGRLDATNTAEHKLLSVITSISTDHTDKLGNSIEEIAYEKAGIINKNSNVIISNNNKGFEIISKKAKDCNSKLYTTNDIETFYDGKNNYIKYNNKTYEFSLLGLYQNKNISLVLKAVEFLNNNGFNITENALIKGLKTVKWPARLEFIKEYNLLSDGAHNPDAALELKKSLDFYFKDKKKIFIYSTINTKDYRKIAEILFNKDDLIYYYEFDYKYAVSFKEYSEKVNWLNNIHKINESEIINLLNDKNLKVLTGSLYMIGSFYKKIGKKDF